MRDREGIRRKIASSQFRDPAFKEKGAELLELAFVLPFFLVMVIGIIDFGGAWAARDQVEGATRNGARVAVANFNDTTNPQCGGGPCSVQAAVDAVVSSLSNVGIPTCGMSSAGIAASGGPFTWSDTAACPNGGTFSIRVARAVPEVDSSSGTNVTVLSTQVTVNYPYSFRFRMRGRLIFFVNPFASFVNLRRMVTMVNLN